MVLGLVLINVEAAGMLAFPDGKLDFDVVPDVMEQTARGVMRW